MPRSALYIFGWWQFLVWPVSIKYQEEELACVWRNTGRGKSSIFMSERDKKNSDVRCLCDEEILDQILLRGERTAAEVVAGKRHKGSLGQQKFCFVPRAAAWAWCLLGNGMYIVFYWNLGKQLVFFIWTTNDCRVSKWSVMQMQKD